MWQTMYGMCLAFPVVAYFFVPVYFSLGITSVYQVITRPNHPSHGHAKHEITCILIIFLVFGSAIQFASSPMSGIWNVRYA